MTTAEKTPYHGKMVKPQNSRSLGPCYVIDIVLLKKSVFANIESNR